MEGNNIKKQEVHSENKLNALFVDICMELWAGDCDISLSFFAKVVRERIDALYSHIGKEAHEHMASMGVIDATGESWIEQDKQTMREIESYQQVLNLLHGTFCEEALYE